MPRSFDAILQALTQRGKVLLRLPQRVLERAELKELCELLLSHRGEASGVALARLVLDRYKTATQANRERFLTALLTCFGVDRMALDKAIAAYNAHPSEATAQQIHEAGEPRRQELLRRLNLAPRGTTDLVKMREELLRALPSHPELRAVDRDFMHLFSSWFNRGFLQLEPINWNTQAAILEKIISYEAVHEIHGWEDLRRRLEPSDRRCFAFFHPQLVNEPLIFVEVALTRKIPDAIGPLLAAKREVLPAIETDTAVFYSISNTHKGLSGVSFGNFLIKQVVEDLNRDLPNIKTFATLSPAPNFAAWLNVEAKKAQSELLDAMDKTTLALLNTPDWHKSEITRERLKPLLMRMAAFYFLHAKNTKNLPIDSVARFHLGNGARLERLNFLGDPSPKGLEQAHGLMINYLYARADIEKNHEAFVSSGQVTASGAVLKLLKNARPHSVSPRASSRGPEQQALSKPPLDPGTRPE